MSELVERLLGFVVALVGVEIVRTLVGSIGLVAAVPVTTALAAFVVTRGSALRVATPPDAPPEPQRRARLRATPPPTEHDIAQDAPAPEAKPTWDQFGPDDSGRW